MYIMLYTMNATDTMAFVDSEYDIFYIVSKDGDEYNSWEWCFTNNIDPIKYRGDDGDESVPEWLIKNMKNKQNQNKNKPLGNSPGAFIVALTHFNYFIIHPPA